MKYLRLYESFLTDIFKKKSGLPPAETDRYKIQKEKSKQLIHKLFDLFLNIGVQNIKIDINDINYFQELTIISKSKNKNLISIKTSRRNL